MNLDPRARRAADAARAAVDAADLDARAPGQRRAPRRGRASALVGAAAVVVALAVTATSLVSDDGGRVVLRPEVGETGSGGSGFALVSSLRPFDDCEQLTTYARDRLLAEVGPYGLEGGEIGTFGFASGAAMEDARARSLDTLAVPVPAAPAGGAVEDEAASAAPGVVGTNVQEAGVDEPDLVQTDGELMVALAQGELQVVDLRGDEPRLASTVAVPAGAETNVLLAGDRALVLTTGNRDGGSSLQLIGLADPAAPEVLTTLELDGELVESRLVDGVAQIVVRSTPSDLPFTTPDPAEPGAPLAEQLATEQNRAVIQSATVEDLLPTYRRAGDDAGAQPLLGCNQVARPPQAAGTATLALTTFDLAQGLEPLDSVGVLGAGDTAYASPTSLYLAGTRYDDEDGAATTAIHQFDTTDPSSLSHLGSGEVAGTLLNQYAMSEHEGVLRVATTQQSNGAAQTDQSSSTVTTLDDRDGALVALGRVGDLGRGEQIFAVRFVGEQGYVVTFRQTDPLFVIDLADPAAPRLTGELQMPGYSAYLHPVGDGRLLGVGQDGTADGQLLGAAISLFDVSDPTAPVRLDTIAYPDGQSEVELDPRAFLALPDGSLAVVPLLQSPFGARGFSGAVAVDVTDDAIEERGRVTHGGSDDSTALVRRSVVVDDVLYTLSERGLHASDLATLEERSFLDF